MHPVRPDVFPRFSEHGRLGGDWKKGSLRSREQATGTEDERPIIAGLPDDAGAHLIGPSERQLYDGREFQALYYRRHRELLLRRRRRHPLGV